MMFPKSDGYTLGLSKDTGFCTIFSVKVLSYHKCELHSKVFVSKITRVNGSVHPLLKSLEFVSFVITWKWVIFYDVQHNVMVTNWFQGITIAFYKRRLSKDQKY